MAGEPFQGSAGAPIPPPVRDVLLLEPDPVLATVLSDAFLRVGRRTRVARTMAELRRAMRERLPGVLVAEIWPEDGDLRTLLSELRRLEFTAGLPILALLPEGIGRLRRDLLAHGADAVYQHPIDPDDVARAVAAELRRAPRLSTAPGVDPLTGLLNRGGWLASWEAAATSGEGAERSLVMLEVEGIDVLRRAVGWDGTDRCAIQIAAFLEDALGDACVLGRWASLRFVGWVPGAILDPATLQERVRALLVRISSHRFRGFDGVPFQIRVHGSVVHGAAPQADRALIMGERALGFDVPVRPATPAPGAVVLLSADPRLDALADARFPRLALARVPLGSSGAGAVFVLDGTPEGGERPERISELRAEGATARPSMHPTSLNDVPAHDLVAFDSEVDPLGPSNEAWGRPPILWIAPLGAQDEGVLALGLGADDVLFSPFSPSEFEGRLLRLLP
jgi:DNA-binding response OmpR family regulator